MINPISSTFERPFYRQNAMDRLVTFAIYSVFFLLPWYYNTSGQIQPVDVNVLITFVFIAISYRFFGVSLLRYSQVYLALFVFLIYAIVRLSIGYIYTGNDAMLYSILEIGYHIILILTFVSLLFYLFSLHSLEKFYKIITFCLSLSTLLPFLDLIVAGPGDGRASLTFNNANQLGFFALVNLCCFFYMILFAHSNKIKINILPAMFIINVNVLFLFLSASRAASIAIMIGIFSYPFIFQFKLSKGLRLLLWVAICLISSIAFAYGLFDYMQQSRDDMTFVSQTSLFEDIYVRAIEGIDYNLSHLAFFIFGSGEETNPLRQEHLEFHNNFLLIFNQFGLLGLLIYSFIVLRILLSLFRKGILYTLPFLCYLFYSDLQYAFRTRSNWLLFAMIIFILLYSKQKKRKKQNREPA